jgi:hypothetical protein
MAAERDDPQGTTTDLSVAHVDGPSESARRIRGVVELIMTEQRLTLFGAACILLGIGLCACGGPSSPSRESASKHQTAGANQATTTSPTLPPTATTITTPPPPTTTTMLAPTTTSTSDPQNVSFEAGPDFLMEYIQTGYCSASDNIGGQCSVLEAQGGSGIGAPGSVSTDLFWLCKSSVQYCNSNGSNAEAKANVIEFSSPQDSLAYLQTQKESGTWLTGYQVNQWSVTIAANGITPEEATKLETAESAGAAIIDFAPKPPLHITQVF